MTRRVPAGPEISVDIGSNTNATLVSVCSGYRVRLTHERSPVRNGWKQISSPHPRFTFPFKKLQRKAEGVAVGAPAFSLPKKLGRSSLPPESPIGPRISLSFSALSHLQNKPQSVNSRRAQDKADLRIPLPSEIPSPFHIGPTSSIPADTCYVSENQEVHPL